MPLAGVLSSGPVMNRAASVVTPGTFNPSKVLSAPCVVEHGLLIVVTLVLGSAAMSFEALEVLTGIIGAVAVCVMKESTSRHQKCVKCVDEPVEAGETCQPTVAGGEVVPSMKGAEDPCSDQEHVQCGACAHAEMSKMRAENDLESWKLKVESDEAELEQLHSEIAKLEQDLLQPTEMQIDALLMKIFDAKLRAEEVEAELVQSNAKMAELDNEISRASALQLKAEENAQTSLEASLTDLMEANFQWTDEHMDVSWPDELYEPLNTSRCASQILQ